MIGLAEVDQAGGILGVVLEQQALWGERVVDPVADGVSKFGLGHAAMQGQGTYQHHVVDTGAGGQVENRLDDPLAVVRAVHGRQRQGDVVEGDGQPHAREQQLRQRGRVEGMEQGLDDGLVGVVERVEGLRRVDHPRPSGRQPLEPEALPVPRQDGRGGAVDVEHKTGTRHDGLASSVTS